MIDFEAMGKREVAYCYTTPKGVYHFAVDRILASPAYAKAPRADVEMDQEFARHLITNGGIEIHRFERLTREAIRKNPVVFAELPEEGSHILIDGAHRYVRANYFGFTHVPAVFLAEEAWRPYQIRSPWWLPPEAVREAMRQGWDSRL